MQSKLNIIAIIALVTAVFTVNAADIEKLMPDFSGNVMVRGVADVKDFNPDTDPAYNNVLKVRFGFEKEVYKNIFIKAEVQDSRMLGQTNNLTAEGNHVFDLFQGYVDIKDIAGTGLGIKAGRFQMMYGTRRVIGNSAWNINERKFDGAILKYHKKRFSADLFYTYYNDETPYLLKSLPNMYGQEKYYRTNVYGLWTTTDLQKAGQLHIFGVMESDSKNNNGAEINLNRATVGFNHFGKFGDLKTTVESAYQLGSQETDNGNTTVEKDIAAYMFGFQAKYKPNRFEAQIGTYMFSGQDAGAKETTLYNNGMGNKHNMLGSIDYFISIKGGTAGLGINNFYAGVGYDLIPKKLNASLIGHYHMTNQEAPNGDNTLGSEIDLELKYQPVKNLVFKGGGALFFADDLMQQIWNTDESMSYWGYLMVQVGI